MNKKNSGFSLVELIVVIAIMAVLVGVLAPAYLKYVEKSRKSTDVSALADIINASSSIAADVQFDLPAKSQFEIKKDGTSLKIEVKAYSAAAALSIDTDATSEWKSVAKCEDGYKLKSKEFSGYADSTDANKLIGYVMKNGSVNWKAPNSANASTEIFAAMVKYSQKDLGSKFTSVTND